MSRLASLSVLLISSSAVAQSYQWTNPAGGLWRTDANWSPTGYPNTSGESALIALPGSYSISLISGIQLDSFQMTAFGATLNIQANSAIDLLAGGDCIVNGTIHVNPFSGDSWTYINFAQNTTLSGNGYIHLHGASSLSSNSAQVTIASGKVLTLNPPCNIYGQGSIAGGEVINNGVIAAGGSLYIQSKITGSPASEIRGAWGANTDEVRYDSFATIVGGRLTDKNHKFDGGKISGTTITGECHAYRMYVLSGGIVNNQRIFINDSTNNFYFLRFDESATISGTGRLHLRALPANLGTAAISSLGGSIVFTNSGDHRIIGNGRITTKMHNQGIIAPGNTDSSNGTIELQAAATLGSQSRLLITIQGSASNHHDWITSSSSIALGGHVSFSLLGWNPTAACSQLPFLTASSITGTFNTYSVDDAPPAGKVWRLHYTPATVSLKLTCPADFNADCSVDDADFATFATQYDLLLCSDPAMPQYCPSDLNSDGLVDDADFVLFGQAYDALLCS